MGSFFCVGGCFDGLRSAFAGLGGLCAVGAISIVRLRATLSPFRASYNHDGAESRSQAACGYDQEDRAECRSALSVDHRSEPRMDKGVGEPAHYGAEARGDAEHPDGDVAFGELAGTDTVYSVDHECEYADQRNSHDQHAGSVR